MKEKRKTAYVPPKLEKRNVVTEGFIAQSLQNPIDMDINSFEKYNWDEQTEIVNPDVQIVY